VDGTGEETWTVTLALGAYTYRCDPHRTTLIGDFTVGTGQAPRTAPRLFAQVGPRSQISLTTASGRRVRTLKAGSYRIVVRDLTRRDNFHLRGPGVNRRTGTRFLGSTTWLVGLGAGRVYRYFSDARPKTMRGTFRVAGASQAQRLVAAVGPGFTISLRSAGGKRVRTLRPGTYRIVVRDRSGVHNFHLRGPGVNRRTGVSFVGTTTWTLRLRKGVYSFVCNPHEGVMHGAFRVR
jgi:plastocyanin